MNESRLPWRHLRRAALCGVVLASAACTEPNRGGAASAPPAPRLEAYLLLSDSTARDSSAIDVTVQLRGTAYNAVGSFTARISFDSTGLRYLGEEGLTDQATRMANPQPGLLRIAGIAPEGFGNGRLFVARFEVMRPSAVSSLRLVIDEIHSKSREDVIGSLAGRAP
jgi:hypothetical protein